MTPDPALDVLERLQEVRVGTICVCPGARNAEWVSLLSKPNCGFEVVWFPEERSAAFFAVGRIRSTGLPTAVVTTSGTAVGELLPAAMEAYYSGLPLILLTADRPRRFRGSGAPQAAEQAGIFGAYAPTAYDLEGAELLPGPLPVKRKPIHINVCFEDPNASAAFDGPPQKGFPRHNALAKGEAAEAGGESNASLGSDSDRMAEAIADFRRPLVIVGSVLPRDRTAVENFLSRLQAPAYAESLSGLRGRSSLEPWTVRLAENLLARAKRCGYEPDGVIRIGGVPTHRLWRDLEELELPVVSVSELEFSGLGRPSTHLQMSLANLNLVSPPPAAGATALIESDRRLFRCLESALEQEPNSELGLFREMSNTVPRGAVVYLGNSLPVREWDLAASWADRGIEVRASRGLNGIDGQVSTFLGMCRTGLSNWAILGDLTTVYDLAGPWPIKQLPRNLDASLVVVNNGGGKIFDRMFPEPAFQNRHTLSFEHWAAMWDLNYTRAETAEELKTIASQPNRGLRVIELIPDEGATKRFWAAFHGALN